MKEDSILCKTSDDSVEMMENNNRIEVLSKRLIIPPTEDFEYLVRWKLKENTNK